MKFPSSFIFLSYISFCEELKLILGRLQKGVKREKIMEFGCVEKPRFLQGQHVEKAYLEVCTMAYFMDVNLERESDKKTLNVVLYVMVGLSK